MFAVAIEYTSIAPGITMTQFWEIAWETFFHNVHYGRRVSAITRTALGNTVRVEYDGKDFRFSIN